MITPKQIDESIELANKKEVFLPKALELMDGMSTLKTRMLFNKLASFFPKRSNYLEVGCWKGATFCSTMYSNKINGTAIDNFSQFTDHEIYGFAHQRGKSFDVCVKNIFDITLWNTEENDYKLYNCDAFQFDIGKLPKIDFYFYDGEHSVESQCKAYTHFDKVLPETFLTIVDDWADGKDTAAEGTFKAFDELGYKVEYSRELPASKNSKDQSGWWNGLYIAIIKK